MKMQVIKNTLKKQWKITRMLTSQADVEENYRLKGFHLCIGLAEDCDQPDKKYFLKFFILNGDEREKANAMFALMSELKFQIRHPYVVYVERMETMQMIPDMDDVYQSEFSWICEEMTRQSSGSLQALCLMEEYADGQELGEYYSETGETVSDDQMFRHMYQLLQGMCGYYGRFRKDPLIHRDIKPSNIIVRKNDHSLLYIDFDLSHSSGSTKTQSGKRMLGGTPGYADPRQYEMLVRKSDIRMDIYALGMVFLYMMTGNHYVQTSGQFSEEEMTNWSYLEQKQGREYLYHVKREKLVRNGDEVFQDEKYDSLVHIVNRMIHENLDVEEGDNVCRYHTPQEVMKDFKEYIHELYGENAEKILSERKILSAESVRRREKETDRRYIQVYSSNGYSRIITMKEDQVIQINLDYGNVILLNATEDGIHFFVTVKNTVNSSYTAQKGDLLTKTGYEFTIDTNRYRIKEVFV